MMNWFVWALLSALFAGLTAVLAKVGVKDVDSNVATAVRTLVVLLLSWAIVLWRGGWSGTIHAIPRRTWIYLTLSGLATGASWLCYFRALQLGEVAKVAPIDKCSVVVAMGLAALLLGEPLHARHLFGGMLILAGVLVLTQV